MLLFENKVEAEAVLTTFSKATAIVHSGKNHTFEEQI